MIKYFLLAPSLFFFFTLAAQPKPDAHYALRQEKGFVSSKNYYLLTSFMFDKAVRKLLQTDNVLNDLSRKRKIRIDSALHNCTGSVSCLTAPLKFSETEIKEIGDRLLVLYDHNKILSDLVLTQLIPSGTYILYGTEPKELLSRAWEQDAHGINFAIGVYAEGNKAHYPNIDSIAFNVNDKRYPELVYNATYTMNAESPADALFFTPSLDAALGFLQINERENAADFEPMQSTANKAAFDRVRTIHWKDYAYSVILVPGAGPEEPTVALSAEGMLRCRLAAVQYRKGLAPFIMVSGGKVHPYKTKYCEAEEMGRYLVQTLNIPADAVIMEPHARHTTTNMRNCARLIFRYGMPFDKPGLVTTTRYQSMAIGTSFVERCRKELNEIPYRVGKRLSETELEFFPLIEALQINPEEPMDP